jgi:mannose/fructose/N-acetylgalactosamine-specific phosphotransferase system component IIB
MATKESKGSPTSGYLYVRVDNRLLHGQVVQFWIGHLKIEHLVVADDEVAENEALMAIYRLAMPKSVGLTITPLDPLTKKLESLKSKKTMVLLKDIDDAERVLSSGAAFKRVTLGNIHASALRSRVTDSVYLSDDEVKKLVKFKNDGIDVEIQTFPGDTLRLEVDQKGDALWVKS